MKQLVVEVANRALDPVPAGERREQRRRAAGTHPLGGAGRIREVVEEAEREDDVERAGRTSMSRKSPSSSSTESNRSRRAARELEHVRREVDPEVRASAGIDHRFRDAARAAAEVEDVRAGCCARDGDRKLPSAPGPSPEGVVAGGRPGVEAVDRVGALLEVAPRRGHPAARSPGHHRARAVDYSLRGAVHLGKRGAHVRRPTGVRRVAPAPRPPAWSHAGSIRGRARSENALAGRGSPISSPFRAQLLVEPLARAQADEVDGDLM